MDKIIDQAVADYLSQLDESLNEFFKDTDELQKEGLSNEQILGILAGLNIADYWLKDLQMQQAISTYLEATGYLLDDMFKFGKITETELLALRKMQESAIMNYSSRLGEEIRLGLSEGVSNGFKGSRLKEAITSKVSLNPGRIEGIVATTLSTYNRSITNIMAQDLPSDTIWHYHNPLDDKTRPICRVMLAEGGLTQAEIERKFPGALKDGGGINCRGQWLPTKFDNDIVVRAKEEVSNNPKKFNKAKTLLEYSRGNSKT